MNDTTSLLTVTKARTGVFVNVALILRKDREVLLHLRKNTGFADGYYGLVSGHVENNEPAKQAMIREAYEEARINILPEHLHLVHVMHRKTNRFNVDLFFECTSWSGTITNNEPDRCEELAFFPVDSLPENTIDAISQAIKNIAQGQIYDEMGWT